MIFPALVGFLFLLSSAEGGSFCPPRENIYPCTCANFHISKRKVATIVTCQSLGDSDALGSIFPALRSMEMDQFHLYDSFWEAHRLGDDGEHKKHLPHDWMTLLKIKEMEIVDSTMSSCFACQWTLNCRNSVTTSFKMTNSSSSEKMCTLCDNGRGNKYPWTACMSNLQKFSFTYGKISTLGVDFFPLAMRELKTLDMSYNQIVKIDPNAFKNLPNLISLNLSHNAIEYIDHLFGGLETHLQILDVSYNFVKVFGADLFSSVPHLKTFHMESNMIVNLKLEDWANMPKNITRIYLNGNPLHCDCNVKWINSTLSVGAVMEGLCSSPDEYQSTQVRKASRLLLTRCDDQGNIRPRTTDEPRTTKASVASSTSIRKQRRPA